MSDIDLNPSGIARVQQLYDPANGVNVSGNAELSHTALTPLFVSVEGMDGTTTFTVQVQLSPNGAWHDYQVVDNTVANALVEFVNPPSRVRVQRSGGSNDVVVYAQG
jgi:hypothetical protein